MTEKSSFSVMQSCDGVLEFDGSRHALLNVGSYLLSYEVLQDFMFHFLKGRYVNNNNNNHLLFILIESHIKR